MQVSALKAWCRSAATGPYQAGRSKHWVKLKNRKHPAIERVMESFVRFSWPWASNHAKRFTAVRSGRRRAAAARKEADILACEAWNQRMRGYRGPAVADAWRRHQRRIPAARFRRRPLTPALISAASGRYSRRSPGWHCRTSQIFSTSEAHALDLSGFQQRDILFRGADALGQSLRSHLMSWPALHRVEPRGYLRVSRSARP